MESTALNFQHERANIMDGGEWMLVVISNLRELRFGELMEVYKCSNQENGKQNWPDETLERQLALAEQDFYDYLRQCFFKITGAVYCVWRVSGHYVSALRLEPWKDGLLLTGLETAPEQRGKGYAYDLIRAVQTHLAQQGTVTLYSHINNHNTASIAVHEKCGFRKLLDHATYLDGTVDCHSGTYICDA
jgi:RimJ/RimL family protein N-acetyltransferase